MKYNNKVGDKICDMHAFYLFSQCRLYSCGLYSHSSVILPSFFLSGLPSGWGKIVNVCASQPMAQGLRHQVEELWEELSRLCSNRSWTESSQTHKNLNSSVQKSENSKGLFYLSFLNKWKNDTPRMEVLGFLASGDRREENWGQDWICPVN